MGDLAKRLCDGEPAAFAELYDACADRLHHFLVLRLGSTDDAADVLQETFLRLARSRARMAQVADPIGYAFVIARNEAARWLARHSRGGVRRTLRADELFEDASCDNAAERETAESLTMALPRNSN